MTLPIPSVFYVYDTARKSHINVDARLGARSQVLHHREQVLLLPSEGGQATRQRRARQS